MESGASGGAGGAAAGVGRVAGLALSYSLCLEAPEPVGTLWLRVGWRPPGKMPAVRIPSVPKELVRVGL